MLRYPLHSATNPYKRSVRMLSSNVQRAWQLIFSECGDYWMKVLGTFVGLKMLHTHMANKDVYIETEEKRTSVISTLDILLTTQLSGITARAPSLVPRLLPFPLPLRAWVRGYKDAMDKSVQIIECVHHFAWELPLRVVRNSHPRSRHVEPDVQVTLRALCLLHNAPAQQGRERRTGC